MKQSMSRPVIQVNKQDIEKRKNDLNGINLRDMNLAKIDLSKAKMKDVDLRHSNLRGANLKGVDLRYAYLGGADFTDADLEGAKLNHADMEKTNFTGTNLKNTILDESRMIQTILTKTNMTDSSIKHTTIRGVDFEDTVLDGVDFSETHMGFCKNIGQKEIISITSGKVCEICTKPFTSKNKKETVCGEDCRAELYMDMDHLLAKTENKERYYREHPRNKENKEPAHMDAYYAKLKTYYAKQRNVDSKFGKQKLPLGHIYWGITKD